MPPPTPWDEQAANWVKWARTPGHDVFSYFAPAFFDELLPAPRGRTLEIGCGEGRVARELTSRGHRVVAVDASAALVRYAREADAVSAYLSATGPVLPFADATFQTVVAYNSLQTMEQLDDMAHTVREAARVLEPSGSFCLCVAHPFTDIDRGNAPAGDPPSYFEPQRVADTVTAGGLTMTFHGWTYTLQDYTRALEDAGLIIEQLREPVPSDEHMTKRPSLARWQRAPLFLMLRAVKAN